MHQLRKAAEEILPQILPVPTSSTLLAIGERYSQYRRYKRSPAPAATRIIERALGFTVQNGPFRGMRYPARNAYSRHAIPKLLGCYEQELHPGLTRLLADESYRRFVDIGAAEGYYSVGFAFATGRPVFAFEIDPFERRFSRIMARANNVEERIVLNGWCTPHTLKRICPDRSLIFCDCEGYETELFTADVINSLSHSDFLIELHPLTQNHSDTNLFLSRFTLTHEIELVAARQRYAADYPEMVHLRLLDDQLVSEFRQAGQQWAIATGRSR